MISLAKEAAQGECLSEITIVCIIADAIHIDATWYLLLDVLIHELHSLVVRAWNDVDFWSIRCKHCSSDPEEPDAFEWIETIKSGVFFAIRS